MYPQVHRSFFFLSSISSMALGVALAGAGAGACSGSNNNGEGGGAGEAGSGAGAGLADGGVPDSGPDPNFGTDGYGKGDIAQAPCKDVTNAMGTVIDMQWPSPSNIGHDGDEGSSLHFYWSGSSHNVVQIDSWLDYWHPNPSLSDPGFLAGFKSGPKTDSADLYLNYGTFPCGYRPGIYFFADQDNPAGGIVSSSMTVQFDPVTNTNAYYDPKPCSALANPDVYGGRYWAYANRPDCTVFEINNFQTTAHYDWLPDTFHKQQPKQGDVVIFRWTGYHNVVQVHDVLQEKLVPGGITNGPKKECVAGPHYSCANGPPILGEYMIDTEDYRPGILHFSDEDAIHNPTTMECWNPGCTGMNQQFQLQSKKATEEIKCCDLPGASGKYSQSCRVVDIYNDGEGAQWTSYNIGAGGNDIVRFRWAGTIKLYQVMTDGKTPKPGGFGMKEPVECVPGPHFSCLNGTTDQAQFLFDVGEGLLAKNYEQDQFFNITWPVYAEGEATPGFTSNNAGAIIYPTSMYDPNDPKCP